MAEPRVQSARMDAAPPTIEGSERESWLAAQARHRFAARLWSLGAEATVALSGLAICVLLAPLGVALIGLALDLANLAVRVPNLIGPLGDWLSAGRFGWDRPTVAVVLCLPLPGIVVLALGAWRMQRLLPRDHAALLRSTLGARDPRSGDLDEIQLRNLVEEIAIAASRRPPAVLMLDHASSNLGWIGGADGATLVVTRGLLDALGRDQTQALVALAIASIGNGDGAMATRLVRTVQVIGLLVLFSHLAFSSDARRAMAPVIGLGRGEADDAARLELLQRMLADPWHVPDDPTNPRRGMNTPNRLTPREWLTLPIMGSMMIGIVLIPFLSMISFMPMVGLLWRRRRLLADATVVQFTRHPQALGEALLAVEARPTQLADQSAWLVNLFAFEAGPSAFRLPTPYPPLRQRIGRLNAMGAHLALPADTRQRMPLALALALLPLGLLLAVLAIGVIALGAVLSVMLNLLFLGLPVGAVHGLLRWIGG